MPARPQSLSQRVAPRQWAEVAYARAGQPVADSGSLKSALLQVSPSLWREGCKFAVSMSQVADISAFCKVFSTTSQRWASKSCLSLFHHLECLPRDACNLEQPHRAGCLLQVSTDVRVTAQLRRKLTGPDRTLDTDVDAAASGLEQWLFARARSARDAPLQTNLARQPRLHNDAGSIDQRAADVIRWLGLPQASTQSSAVSDTALQQERGRVHVTPQQSLSGALTSPQAFPTAGRSAVGAGWQRDRAAGGSVVDSAAAERASVTRALTHREKMEAAATQRMLVRVCVCARTHTCTHCHTHTLSHMLSHTLPDAHSPIRTRRRTERTCYRPRSRRFGTGHQATLRFPSSLSPFAERCSLFVEAVQEHAEARVQRTHTPHVPHLCEPLTLAFGTKTKLILFSIHITCKFVPYGITFFTASPFHPCLYKVNSFKFLM